MRRWTHLRAEPRDLGLGHRERVAALALGLELLQVALQRAARAVLEDGVRVLRAKARRQRAHPRRIARVSRVWQARRGLMPTMAQLAWR